MRFDAPSIPEDWRERETTASLDTSTVSMLDAELTNLGRTVQEELGDYLERSDVPAEYVWLQEPFGQRGE